jgi:hypothetical protein
MAHPLTLWARARPLARASRSPPALAAGNQRVPLSEAAAKLLIHTRLGA